jgi:hypothetical protein
VASGRWFLNDAINVLSADNQERIRAELVVPNVVFGLHRWYAGGSSPTSIALSSQAEWDLELSRCRPGDNLVLVSLRRVRHLALAHAGVLSSGSPPVLSSPGQERLLAFLHDHRRELAVLHRHVGGDGRFECDYDIVWDPSPEEWSEHLERWSRLQGELLFFDDDEILWRDKSGRQGVPPEEWASNYGDYLFDGYFPDARGRVVVGGAY